MGTPEKTGEFRALLRAAYYLLALQDERPEVVNLLVAEVTYKGCEITGADLLIEIHVALAMDEEAARRGG